MELRITSRHARMAEGVKEYAEEKLGSMARYNRHTRSMDVVFDEDHLMKTVEIIAHVDHGAPVVVNARHEEARGAVDIAHDKLERALRRLKERTDERRRGKGDPGAPAQFADDAAINESSTEQE